MYHSRFMRSVSSNQKHARYVLIGREYEWNCNRNINGSVSIKYWNRIWVLHHREAGLKFMKENFYCIAGTCKTLPVQMRRYSALLYVNKLTHFITTLTFIILWDRLSYRMSIVLYYLFSTCWFPDGCSAYMYFKHYAVHIWSSCGQALLSGSSFGWGGGGRGQRASGGKLISLIL